VRLLPLGAEADGLIPNYGGAGADRVLLEDFDMGMAPQARDEEHTLGREPLKPAVVLVAPIEDQDRTGGKP